MPAGCNEMAAMRPAWSIWEVTPHPYARFCLPAKMQPGVAWQCHELLCAQSLASDMAHLPLTFLKTEDRYVAYARKCI